MTDSGSGRGGIDTDERDRVGRAMATVRSVAVIALVVTAASLAGCGMLGGGGGGDGGDGGAGGNVDAPREVSEPMDPSASEVYSRVQGIIGAEASAPNVLVSNLATDQNISNAYLTATIGLPENPSSTLVESINVSYDPEDDAVVFNEETVYDMTGPQIEAALAYGFAVSLHYKNDWIENNRTILGYERRALVTGTVGEATRAYVDEHMDGETEYAVPSFEETGAYRWAFEGAMEYYGAQYVDSAVESPSEIPSIYEDGGPATTEQMLHDTDEAAMDLTLDASASNWWTVENIPFGSGAGTFGELGTRAILRSHLSESEAAAAADGWGNDSAVAFRSVRNESTGVVWVHRWDSASEADEFVNATEAYADAREDGKYAINVTRPAEDATVVVAHRGNFMSNAEIAYEGGTAEVVVGGGAP
ncbi:hypothetical protein [Halosimplex marinum]|uniref:hypothetical protein n=1 Tax=Halosimplex marinum TaxID=3396620 RepID=UPI003F564CD0